jgi:membrane-associated phospholipid phosphatase
MDDPALLRRLDRRIWTIVAIVAAIVLAAPAISDFRIAWSSFTAPALATGVLVAGSWFYRSWRVDLRLSSGLVCSAQIIAFAAVGAPLSYLAAAAAGGLPLYDPALHMVDHALGFDWKALLAAMNETPWLLTMLGPIYLSLMPQMTTAVLCLAFRGRLLWLRVYMLAFLLSALITIAISALLPAVGAWPYLGLTAVSSPDVMPSVSTNWPLGIVNHAAPAAVFYGLRDGSLRTLMGIGSEGIITFPSLHAALGVVLIAALWPIPILRWFILALNVTMLVSTPIDGSHYLVDVLAGIAVAIICFYAARIMAVQAARVPASEQAAATRLPRLVPGE